MEALRRNVNRGTPFASAPWLKRTAARLVWAWKPACALRGLQQASALKKVQRQLGCPRTSLGSLSESVAVFDPTRLEGIIGALLAEVPRAQSIGRGQIPQVLTAVRGTTEDVPFTPLYPPR